MFLCKCEYVHFFLFFVFSVSVFAYANFLLCSIVLCISSDICIYISTYTPFLFFLLLFATSFACWYLFRLATKPNGPFHFCKRTNTTWVLWPLTLFYYYYHFFLKHNAIIKIIHNNNIVNYSYTKIVWINNIINNLNISIHNEN